MMYLEELSLVGFKGWGKEVVYEGKSIQNAKLSEFKYLPHLISLKLTIPCVNSLSDLSFSDNLMLERFDINIGKFRDHYNKRKKSLRYLRIHGESNTVLNDNVDKVLLKRCDELRLEAEKDISKNFFKSNRNYGYPDLRHLSLQFEDRLIPYFYGELIPCFDDQVSFPKLESLEFIRAWELRMLWKDNGMISNSFSKLGRIHIRKCDNLRYMFPCSAMTTLVSLKVLKIEKCVQLEGIFSMKEGLYILKENDDVALPKLSFVGVEHCPRLKSVFPASIKYLPQLLTLEINRGPCQLLFEDKRLEIAQSNSSPFHEDQIVFPNLRRLRLSYKAMKINSLVTQFYRAESFPKLKFLTLEGSDDGDYDWNTLPLGFRQVLFSPKELEINKVCVWKDNTDIWKMFFDHLELPDSIKFNSFPNLKSLRIDECNGLKNMLNSSVVKRLVKLEKMMIKSCRGMISIVDGDGDDEEEEIIFNKLVELQLYNLERLESFHSGKSKLMFPCLEKLIINRCYNMKIFSNGRIRKPKLKELYTDCPRIFKKKEEEEEEEEEEEDEEEQEEEEEVFLIEDYYYGLESDTDA